jgi:hypothetical protein
MNNFVFFFLAFLHVAVIQNNRTRSTQWLGKKGTAAAAASKLGQFFFLSQFFAFCMLHDEGFK